MSVDINHILQEEFLSENLDFNRLDGYVNANYLITAENSKYIFKTYPYSKSMATIVSAENNALLHLQETASDNFPKPISFKDASYIKHLKSDEEEYLIRKLSYLEGELLGGVQHDHKLLRSLGRFLAKMDLKLQGFNSYVYQARQFEWDIQYVHLNQKYINDIPLAKNRKLVQYFFQQYNEHVRPSLPLLRKQIIHNDANEWNVLTQNGEVSGIIDFGDMTYSLLINELAVAITYACYDKENPIEWAAVIIQAYHELLPLTETELSVLYYLIAARLCISVCNSAHSSKVNPDNSYISVSEKPAWSMLEYWLSIGPIKAENAFRKAIGLEDISTPSVDRVVNKRAKHISSSYSLSYDEPIHMVKSAFQYMYDAKGNSFLDAYNNIPHVGHCHPKVVEAGQRQMAMLNTNTRYLYNQLAEYAERLQSKYPSSLNKIYFVNSGSAATDLALRMAKFHTGYNNVMVMELGYHGNTQSSMEVSDYKFDNPKGDGIKDHIIKTDIPDTYKGKYAEHNNPGQLYASDAIAQIQNCHSPIAAFIAEPIVGCAGQVPLAPGYLKEIYPVIRKQGGVCISDEVQTGFGRVGHHFWGYEAHDVVPDIVIMGKPIANGHPMGAIICTEEIATSFEKSVEFFSSFGGNPISCAIASAVLDVIEEEQLQENAKAVGDYYISRLRGLADKYNCIGDVRGMGLFIGVELVINNSKQPNTKLAKHIKNSLRNKNILISTDGRYDNILKSKPALCFNKSNVDKVVDSIEELLSNYKQ